MGLGSYWVLTRLKSQGLTDPSTIGFARHAVVGDL